MKKKILIIVPVVLIVGVVAFSFIRDFVPITRLAGAFVGASDNSLRLVFDGDNVTLYENGNPSRSGTYNISGRDTDFLRISFEGESLLFWLRDDRNTIYYHISERNEEGQYVTRIDEVAFRREN